MVASAIWTCQVALERAWEGHPDTARYEDRRHDIERPLLPPGEVFDRTPPSVQQALSIHPMIGIERFASTDLEESPHR